MMRRLISRDRAPVQPASEMPPRPPEGRRADGEDMPWHGAATWVCDDPRLDPCGGPPLEAA